MAKKAAVVLSKSTVGALVSDAFAELQSLGEELREWYDNLPEGLQSTRDDISEAADTLEGLTEPEEAPEAVREIEVEYRPLTKRKASRRDRRDQAVYEIGAAIEAAQAWEPTAMPAPTNRFSEEELPQIGLAIKYMLERDGVASVRVLDDRGGTGTFLIEPLDADGNVLKAAEAADPEEAKEEVSNWVDEVQQMADEADGVDFPGMYA